MELVFDHPLPREPEVSLVLLDWDCRESYHFLDYLARQDVPRERFEVIWIEYYTKRAPELAARLREAQAAGAWPPLDRYIVLDHPAGECYDKHLMYNVGIALARGRIVCNLDSDAMARPGFVGAILDAFADDPQLVLHLDQLRSDERRFYPFSHPAFDEVERGVTLNGDAGRPAGLADDRDPLHSRNYGACMAARRADLLAIGGADMHEDYRGYICGPYDLTFRLLNAGKRLRWHRTQWLYHTWHPGQAGAGNHGGPHDGRNMARRALEARRNGRVLPLVEHPVMRQLRAGRRFASPQELVGAFAAAGGGWDGDASSMMHEPTGATV